MRCDGLVAEVADWAAGLEEVHRRIAGAFARSEPRARVLAYLRGLLGQPERKNGWTLAEAAGEVSPDGMQRLLRIADWNADTLRDELGSYVVERLGPGGVLIVDETGFIKKLKQDMPTVVRCPGEAQDPSGGTAYQDRLPTRGPAVSEPVGSTAVLPIAEETVQFVSGLLAAERRRRGTRGRRRALDCYRQAVLVLR